jgi:hypothetical protein
MGVQVNTLSFTALPAANDTNLSPLLTAGLAGAALLVLAAFGVLVARQYKRCPSNRILVIFGRVGHGRSSKCLMGGGAFVMPLVQDCAYLSLEPIAIDIPLEAAPTRDGVRVNVPSTFTVAISTDPVLMNNAVERLLNLPVEMIREQAQGIILGQLGLVTAELTIDEIVNGRQKFMDLINENVGAEIAKLGLWLVNVSVREVTDESGYLQAVGRRAAAEAIRSYLARNPLKAVVDARLRTKDGVTFDVKAEFTFAVEYGASADGSAARGLINLPEEEQKERARGVFVEQLRLLAEELTAAQLAGDPERLGTLARKLAGGEFRRRGLELMNAEVRLGSRGFA